MFQTEEEHIAPDQRRFIRARLVVSLVHEDLISMDFWKKYHLIDGWPPVTTCSKIPSLFHAAQPKTENICCSDASSAELIPASPESCANIVTELCTHEDRMKRAKLSNGEIEHTDGIWPDR